jgi:hypothetical protein
MTLHAMSDPTVSGNGEGGAMNELAVIVGAVRTPLGKRAGMLSGVQPDELLALTMMDTLLKQVWLESIRPLGSKVTPLFR